MTEATRTRRAWIVGGGSGIGRAVAHAAVDAGWQVTVSGRRGEALAQTQATASNPASVATLPLDVVAENPRNRIAEILRADASLDALVVASGTNNPRRRWTDHDIDDVHRVIETNLVGVLRVVDAALPALRRAGGVVVIVSSYAGWTHSPGAGAAYSASKTALASVVRTLNTDEAANGVRACHLCPGDVDTDFLEMRPSVPTAEHRRRMLTPADVARAAMFTMDAPSHVRIDELVISPVSQV